MPIINYTYPKDYTKYNLIRVDSDKSLLLGYTIRLVSQKKVISNIDFLVNNKHKDIKKYLNENGFIVIKNPSIKE